MAGRRPTWFDANAPSTDIYAGPTTPPANDFPLPPGTVPTLATPTPEVVVPGRPSSTWTTNQPATTPPPAAPTRPTGPQADAIAKAFQSWYGHAPSDADLASYVQQATSRPNAQAQVLQNLYQASPAYDAKRPIYTSWSAATTPGTTGTTGASGAAAPPPGSQSAMPGWDQTKWNDPTHTNEKYTVGRILSGYTPSPENLTAAMTQIQAAYPGAKQVGKDSIFVPGLGTIDVGGNFSSGKNMSWWWGPSLDVNGNPIAQSASGPTGQATGAAATSGSTGQTPSLVAASQGTSAASGAAGSPGATGTYGPGSLLTPWTASLGLPAFEQPTVADLEADPGFMSRIKLGQNAIEASAAARGTLNSTGTEKMLSDYTSGEASSEYQSLWGRKFTNYQQTLANLTNEYNSAYGAFRDNQSSAYNMLSGVAGMGANVATGQGSQAVATSGQYGGLVTGNAAAQGDAAMQAANATAAGQVGAANAWNYGLGNATNAGLSLYLSNLYRPQGTTTGYPATTLG